MDNKRLLIPLLFMFSALLLQGCSSSRMPDAVDRNCPSPSKSQLDKNGLLVVENGVTLKYQVKNYTHKMSCTGITDGEDDGWACSSGAKQAVFLFDENEVLKFFKIY